MLTNKFVILVKRIHTINLHIFQITINNSKNGRIFASRLGNTNINIQ